MNKISRIIVKYLTIGTNDEDTDYLEHWRKKKVHHEELFQKLSSREFLENTLDPRHREQLSEEWKKVERRMLHVYRRKLFLRVSQYAAVIVILISGIIFYIQTQDKKVVNPTLRASAIPRSKAIISLAGGEQITVFRDTNFQKNVEDVFVENHKDTISFIPDRAEKMATGKVHRIEVPRGAEYVARLEDGTVVHLDAASTLVVPQAFAGDRREVELTGHAYFSVAKDAARPFLVRTGHVNVRVLGTNFDLKAYEDQEITTTLVEGAVEVYNSRSKCKLKPNQQARIYQDAPIEVKDVDVYPFIAWKEERVVFVNESLVSIMKVLERWYDVQSVFFSEEVKNEPFTIDIEKYADIEDVLMAIEKTDKVSFELQGRQVLIRKK